MSTATLSSMILSHCYRFGRSTWHITDLLHISLLNMWWILFSHQHFIFCELINHIFYLCIEWFNLFYLGSWYIKDINPLAYPWAKFILELGSLCLFLLSFSRSITSQVWVLKMNHFEILIMEDSMTCDEKVNSIGQFNLNNCSSPVWAWQSDR